MRVKGSLGPHLLPGPTTTRTVDWTIHCLPAPQRRDCGESCLMGSCRQAQRRLECPILRLTSLCPASRCRLPLRPHRPLHRKITRRGSEDARANRSVVPFVGSIFREAGAPNATDAKYDTEEKETVARIDRKTEGPTNQHIHT